jgi:hypothetical protein
MSSPTPHRPGQIHRSRFGREEDQLLTELVMRPGLKSWAWIASQLPGRNLRQCRDRWNHFLAIRLPAPSPTQSPSRINTFGVIQTLATGAANHLPHSMQAPDDVAPIERADRPQNPQFEAAGVDTPAEDQYRFDIGSPGIQEFFWSETEESLSP